MMALNGNRRHHQELNRLSVSPPARDKPKTMNKRKKNRSKGTISGYADSVNGIGVGVYDCNSYQHHPLRSDDVAVASSASYSATLSLAAVEGALNLGLRTKLSLCPIRMRNRLLQEDKEGKLREYQMEGEEELSSGDEEEEDLENEMQSIPAASSIGSGTGGISRHSDVSVGTNLAFGQRKIRFFDIVTAKERKNARQCLLKEMRAMKRKDNEPLEEYLKQMNPNIQIQNSSKPDLHSLPFNDSPGMAAALILESLALSPLESIEGMSKCYDGLVAAGTALTDEDKNLLDSTTASVSTESRPSRTKVKAALFPLLITSLSQISGEVILALARLRSLCGTWRYRRRFVQRIAPVLVRPPYAAIWCLKHQNDMGAIVAATELLLDEAQELFSYGWHERGIQLRNDGRRAEFLNAAARQLRNLSTSTAKHRGLLTQPSTTTLPETSLAEWEVLAVDHQIRTSISNIFTKDWSRTLLTPPNPPRKNSDGDKIRPNTCPKSPRAVKIMLHTDDSPTRSPPYLDMPSLKINQAPLTPKTINSNVGPPPRSPSSPPRIKQPPQPPSSPAPPLSPSTTEFPTPRPTPITRRNTLLTPEERKRYVQACRALRAQITRFEEAFIQIHGRPPKGATERSPLATTYAQYREWKRAIRSDAACRIQSLIRAYQTISKLQLTQPKATTIYLTKIRKKYRNKNVIFVPWEIPPQPRPPEKPKNTEPNIPLAEIPQNKLQEMKRELKNILKKYDMEFYRTRGRMPSKQEKEPIRGLYERYNAIKREISTREQNRSSASVASSASSTAYSTSSNSTFSIPQQKKFIDTNPSTSEDESFFKKSGGRDSPSNHSIGSTISDTATPTTAPSTASSNNNQPIFIGDLEALKREKNELHALLRNFERQFYDQHRRQVESFADIRPVANQYRRYKEIKRQIATLTSNK